MSLQLWSIYALTVFVLSMIPGPCMLLAATHGMQHGVRRTLATTFGAISALILMMLASATGLGALLATSEPAFETLKWIGAAYLVYLGIKTWRTGASELALTPGIARVAGRRPLHRLFGQGFWVAASNPKAIVFFGALFPQFIDPARPQPVQYALLCGTFVTFEVAWQVAYAFGGTRLASWFGRADRGRALNRLSGGLFIGLGLLLSMAQRG